MDDNVFLSMIRRGALIPGKDEIFIIDFKIVEKEFPSYLEFMVKSSLNNIELWAYTEGYMMYTVLDNGLLKWNLTGKKFDA